ncbi:MAG: fumarylacetoacetate hydrolase family protein [Anaerolineae bacterium]
MRIITFEANWQRHWGAILGEYAVDLNLAHALFLASRSRDPKYLANTVLEFIQHGPEMWDQARETLEFIGERFVEGVMFPLSRTRLLAPMARPPKIVAIGRNYMEHVLEQNAQVTKTPILFAKYPSSVIGPTDVIRLHTEQAQKVDYEGELGVVIGRPASQVSAAEALDYVFGYTVVNDVSARDLQYSPDVGGQWTRGKSLDTYCPMGPAIVTQDQVPDPQNLHLHSTLNGSIVQDGNTRDMIVDVAHLIEFISHGITLEPGDIIATGTPSGVGHHRQPPVYLTAGDVIEVEIDGVGWIRNPVED